MTNMAVKTTTIQLSTRGFTDIIDITDAVCDAIKHSALKNGIVTIFCPSATSGVTTLELEDGCLTDLRRLFDQIIPANEDYAHNARWGDGNGFSHIRASLLKPSLCVPFVETRLTLSAWQQIIFVDFDNRPRQRELVVQIMGE